MREFMNVAKAVADESRVRILMVLDAGELCACQIQEMLELAPSTVSKHLALLYQARLVDYRKEGRWIFYRLPSPEPGWEFVQQTLEWLRQTLAWDATIMADREKLKQIRSCFVQA